MSKVDIKAADLPPMPQVVAKIIQIDENNIDVSSDQLQRIIAVDPGLTAKILKIANSAFYARAAKVANLSQAITLLGFKTIKSLTLLVSSAGMFPKNKENQAIQKIIWMRSLLSALTAKIIADKTGNRAQTEEVFMATLLKSIGQSILLQKDSVNYIDMFKRHEFGTDIEALHKEETENYSTTSSELSAKAMEKWNFPETLIQVAAQNNYNISDLKEKSGAMGLISALANVIMILKHIGDDVQISSDTEQKYLGYFENLVGELKISSELKGYLQENLYAEIKNDEFYKFCEELFSM